MSFMKAKDIDEKIGWKFVDRIPVGDGATEKVYRYDL